MKKINVITVIILALCGLKLFSQDGGAGNNLVVFASGFDNPVCIANAGDSRLFIVEQAGYIYVTDAQGDISPDPFLDIHEKVTYGG